MDKIGVDKIRPTLTLVEMVTYDSGDCSKALSSVLLVSETWQQRCDEVSDLLGHGLNVEYKCLWRCRYGHAIQSSHTH